MSTPTYTPSHVTTSVLTSSNGGTLSVALPPGQALTALAGDLHEVTPTIFVPTATTSDGFPATMVPVAVSTVTGVS